MSQMIDEVNQRKSNHGFENPANWPDNNDVLLQPGENLALDCQKICYRLEILKVLSNSYYNEAEFCIELIKETYDKLDELIG